MENSHIYKREKYMSLTKELGDASHKALEMPVMVGVTGFMRSLVYHPLIKLLICRDKKALRLLAEVA